MRSELDQNVCVPPVEGDIKYYIQYYDKLMDTMGRKSVVVEGSSDESAEEPAAVPAPVGVRTRIEQLKEQMLERSGTSYANRERMAEVEQLCKLKEEVVFENPAGSAAVASVPKAEKPEERAPEPVDSSPSIAAREEAKPEPLESRADPFIVYATGPYEYRPSSAVKVDAAVPVNSSTVKAGASPIQPEHESEADDSSLSVEDTVYPSQMANRSGLSNGLIEDELDSLCDDDLAEFYVKMDKKKNELGSSRDVMEESVPVSEEKCEEASFTTNVKEDWAPSVTLQPKEYTPETFTAPSVSCDPLPTGQRLVGDFRFAESRPFLFRCPTLSFNSSKASKNLLVQCINKDYSNKSKNTSLHVMAPVLSKLHIESETHVFRAPGAMLPGRPSISIYSSVLSEDSVLYYLHVSTADGDASRVSLHDIADGWLIRKDLPRLLRGASGAAVMLARINEMDDRAYSAFVLSDIVSEVHRRSAYVLYNGRKVSIKFLGSTLSVCNGSRVLAFVKMQGAAVAKLNRNGFVVSGMAFECSCEKERDAWYDAVTKEATKP
ncbi:hypothetical protein PAPHI01_1960 [Pancytospora philotis]|nr:hypothetical protein PAPHI01_1960 [Pancytospora philotis]